VFGKFVDTLSNVDLDLKQAKVCEYSAVFSERG